VEASSEEGTPAALGLLARIGAALVAPRVAARAAARFPGKTGTDAAILIVLVFAVAHTDTAVSSLWTMAAGDVLGGLISLATSLTHAATRDVLFLLIAGASVFVFSGKGRSLGRDFDLACVAYVPIAAVALTSNVGLQIAGVVPAPWMASMLAWVAYAWAAAIAVIAVVTNRESASDAPTASPRARLAGLALLGIAALGLGLSLVWIARHPGVARPVIAGDQAPTFSLPIIDDTGHLGEPRDLADQRGRVVVLDFWATWCGPCRESMPVLESIHQTYRDRGVEVWSINTEGPSVAGAARALASKLGVTTIQLSDDGRVASRFKVTTIPHMVVIDRAGVIRHVHRGFSTAGRLQGELERVIGSLL